MGQYDNHLVNGEALTQVLVDIHTDQQRQDAATKTVADALPTALDVVEISKLWNRT